MNRIKELDGIRGLAILMVLILHYFYQLSLGSVDNGSLLVHLHNFTHWFWSGVDLFFVLSGFLIGGIIIDNRESKNFLQVFYIRRALRILPAYSLLLIAFYALRSQLDPARFGALSTETPPFFQSSPISLLPRTSSLVWRSRCIVTLPYSLDLPGLWRWKSSFTWLSRSAY